MASLTDFTSSVGGMLPGLALTGLAAAGLPKPQTLQQTFLNRGLSPDNAAALSPQMLDMIRSAFGSANTRLQAPFPSLNLDAMGLFPGQRSGFDEAVRQATSQISGDFANRGFIRPENLGAIAGSAAQQVMPQFAPLIGQNMLAALQTPETIAQNRLGGLLNALQAGTGALGARETQQTFAPSLGTNLINSLFGAGGTELLSGGAQSAGALLGLPSQLAQLLQGLFSGSNTDQFSAAFDPNTSIPDLIRLGNLPNSPIPGFGAASPTFEIG